MSTTHQTSEMELNEELLLEQQIQDYISSLSEREKLVMEIAREHLQSSFCIERSVGFVKWLNVNKDKYILDKNTK